MKRDHALTKPAEATLKRRKPSTSQPGSYGRQYKPIATHMTNSTGYHMVGSNPVGVPLGNKGAKRLCDSNRRGLKDRPPQYSALLKKDWLNTLKDDTWDSGFRLPSPVVANDDGPGNPLCGDRVTSENVGKISKCTRSSFSIPTEDLEDSTATTSGCGISQVSRERLLRIYSEMCKRRRAGLRPNNKLKVTLSEIFTQEFNGQL